MLYNIPLFLKRENAHILREHCQDLYKPARRAEQISAAIFLLFHFEYRIFHFYQQKKKKIIKQLKTVNLFFT
jgi:hypothetical protein